MAGRTRATAWSGLFLRLSKSPTAHRNKVRNAESKRVGVRNGEFMRVSNKPVMGPGVPAPCSVGTLGTLPGVINHASGASSRAGNSSTRFPLGQKPQSSGLSAF